MKGTAFRSAQLLGAAVGALAIAMPGAAFAQDAAAPQAEESAGQNEIIVSARKRNETLIDVPVAIAALSNETLTRYNVNDLNAMSSLVPNVTIVKAASGTGASMTIRGVGSTFNDFGIDQTVSINVDGIQISRGFITNVAFFDVEQVEVLKGPQALFFGKNSPGGVVSVRSKGPGSKFEAGIKAGYEFVADEKYVEGFVGGPLSDTLGARLAVRYSNMEGYLHNNARSGPNLTDGAFPVTRPAAKRLVGSDVLTGRLTLKYEPSSDFTAELKVLGNTYEDNGMSAISQAVLCAPGAVLPRENNGASDPTGDCRPDNQTSIGALPVGVELGYPGGTKKNGQLWSTVDSYLTTLRLRYELDQVTFDSVSGYSFGDFKTLSNYNYSSFNSAPGFVTEKSKLFTQELRFLTTLGGMINFAGGVYYEWSDRHGEIATRFTSLQLPANPANGATHQTYREHDIVNKAISAFGQVILNLSDQVEIAGGARFTHETKTTYELNTYVDPRVPGAFNIKPQGLALNNRFKDNNVSPEVTVRYKPNPDLNIYAAYKTGYKSGGASIPTTITNLLTNENIGFGAETSKGGEIGIKGYLFDRKFMFSAVAYNYNLNGLQLVMPETLPSGLFVNFVRNAASAVTKGVELEGSYRLDSNVSFDMGVSYNDAHITKFPNSPCWSLQTAANGCQTITSSTGAITRITDRAGDPLSKAPKWVANAGFNYEAPVSGALSVAISLQGKYSSGYRTQDDGAPYARQEGFATVDGSLRLKGADEKWELALIGRNLTNKYYLLVSSPRPIGAPGELHGVIARPREVAVQASFKF